MAHDGLKLSDEAMAKIFKDMDTNNDSKVSKDEMF